MNVLVTGGAGFIGCNFIRHLLAQRPAPQGGQPRRLDLRWLVEQPEEPAPQRPLYVRPRRYCRRRTGAEHARRAPHRHYRQLRRRKPRRSLDHWPGGLHPDQHRGHVHPAGGRPSRLGRPVQRLPLPARLDRRSIWNLGLRRPGLRRDHALRPQLALCRLEGLVRPPVGRITTPSACRRLRPIARTTTARTSIRKSSFR